MNVRFSICCAVAVLRVALCIGFVLGAPFLASAQTVTILRDALVITNVARGGRAPFAPDAIVAEIVAGRQPAPAADQPISPGATQKWASIQANAEGWFEDRRLSGGAYLATTFDAPADGTYLLIARGHTIVYVNGVPRPGDPYSYGYLHLPVAMKKGANSLLFSVGRGRLRVEVRPPSASPAWINPEDATLPDIRRPSQSGELWAAVPIINAGETTLKGASLVASLPGGKATRTPVPPILPHSVRKVGFRIAPPGMLPAEDSLPLSLTLELPKGMAPPPILNTLSLRLRAKGATYRKTFVSGIDGTVQYYGVNPSQVSSLRNALILSLHGASVEAIGQADAYGPKDWATLVAATNRRPFGFDWEDWGRLDALEVLADAARTIPHDPKRVQLTGHSMGGHGTWSIGSLFPDRFGAIGPSAGWISFETYGGRRANTQEPSTAVSPTSLVVRAANQHNTLLWADNLRQTPVYAVHGDADDNVPVTEMRAMLAFLKERGHVSLASHEEKGAGHWWDNSPAPGADCVDWKPLFELFATSRRDSGLARASADTFTFTTVNPAVSASCRWVRIDQQQQMLLPSRVEMAWEVSAQTVRATTENVAALTISPSRLPTEQAIRRVLIDGKELIIDAPSSKQELFLRRTTNGWQKSAPIEGEKGPTRGSGFKGAFQNRFVFVYGTAGDVSENRWSFERARYDAETFLYRGNGSPEVVADTEFSPNTYRGRNVILYGNRTTNKVWDPLLSDCPVEVQRGQLRVGEILKKGGDLACLFAYPKYREPNCLVAVVAGTGAVGQRLTDRIPYLTSGVALPDWVVANPEVCVRGTEGVLGAGWFGNDWSVKTGESAWQSAAPTL